MKGRYEIRYLPAAINDLEEIFTYIANDRPMAARSWLEKLDQSVSNLASQPEVGVIPRDDRLKRLGYRILIIDKYLVFYVLKNKIVQVRRIIHGARRYKFLL